MAVTNWECSLGRNENRIAAAGHRLAKNFFGRYLVIKVGDVEQIDSGVEANIHQARRFLYISIAATVEGSPEAQNRNL